MSAPDTSADVVTVDEVHPPQGADVFGIGALLGGLDMGAMLGQLGIELPDPDAPTIDDLADQLDELRACVDWIASALLAIAGKVPGRFIPNLPAYPPIDD